MHKIRKILERIKKIRFTETTRIPFFLVLFFILITSLLFFQYAPFLFKERPIWNPDNIYLDESEIECINRLNDGTLYQFGEVVCHNGPFFYIFLSVLNGLFHDNFYTVLIIFALLLYTLSFFFVYKIIKKEIGSYYILGFLLYAALGFVYSLSGFDYSTLFAFFWFLFSIYILFYTKIYLKEAYSGVLLALSFLSKQYYIIPIAIIILLYLISAIKLHERNLDYGRLYKLFFILIPLLIIIFPFHLLFPYFLIYTVLLGNPFLQSEQTTRTVTIFSDGISSAFSKIFYILTNQNDLVLTVVIITLLLSLYWVIRKREFLATFTLFSIVIASVTDLFSLGNNLLMYKRILFIIPFSIAIYLKTLKAAANNRAAQIVCIILAVILLYPALKIIYLDHQTSNLEEEVGYINHYIPQQKSILGDLDRLQYYEYPHQYNFSLLQRRFGWHDRSITDVIEKTGLINISNWEYQELKRKKRFLDELAVDIAQREYDLIFYLPHLIERNVNVVGYIRILAEKNDLPFEQLFPFQCTFYIPTIEEKCVNCNHRIVLHFLNASHCDEMKYNMGLYYKEHGKSICQKDYNAFDIVKDAFILNGFNFADTCDNGGNLLESYENKYEITKKDIIFLFVIMIFIIGFFMRNAKIRKETYSHLIICYKNNKIFFSLIILAIISVLFFYGFSKAFVICDDGYIKDDEAKTCCMDKDKNQKCDAYETEDSFQLKECRFKEGRNYIGIGRICNSLSECIKKAREMNAPEIYLNENRIECVNTEFKTLEEFIACNTNEDCIDAIYADVNISEVVRCGNNGFCQMTNSAKISLKNLYKKR